MSAAATMIEPGKSRITYPTLGLGVYLDRPSHLVPDGGMTFPLFQRGPAQDHPLVQQNIITNLRCLPDDHAHSMVDKETPSDPCPGVNLDSR